MNALSDPPEGRNLEGDRKKTGRRMNSLVFTSGSDGFVQGNWSLSRGIADRRLAVPQSALKNISEASIREKDVAYHTRNGEQWHQTPEAWTGKDGGREISAGGWVMAGK